MGTANINTAMLTWARERSGYSVSEFAHKLTIDEERLLKWESGKQALTFKQAMQFADKAHIPFGYLYLLKAPAETLPIPDLRTLDGKSVSQPSAELMDLVKLMLQRQEWYREYLKQQMVEPNPFVGRFSVHSHVDIIVEDMRGALGISWYPERGNSDDYYRELVSRIESLGILVMRQASLGHFTRPLRVEEFRGFAITDEYAPVIFVNHADAPGARLFTLIHELCHIWIGQSGISDGDALTSRKEEVLCNAVAAELLVPTEEFSRLWQDNLESWQENLAPLELHFRVSRWVLARRALTLGFILYEDYNRYISELKAAWLAREKSSKGGPTYYKTKKAQISQPFSRAVVGQALSGQLLLRDASVLLDGIKPAKIFDFAKELGI
ncbi:XRE family transcriptional regulator [Citrobacter werkmanii]|uniref:XRE family transcriptional regulator n=1 Tax=Citrobacter werkmanii TaxID=67827 RepID=UPI00271D2BBA|nr:XRE family transcriptional regulator [Citrobacter werkmanii]MDO8235838.1 XRE family transcriptional regulator [Citrobacter werkmanii]